MYLNKNDTKNSNKIFLLTLKKKNQSLKKIYY
jgi:hypothetical protein